MLTGELSTSGDAMAEVSLQLASWSDLEHGTVIRCVEAFIAEIGAAHPGISGMLPCDN